MADETPQPQLDENATMPFVEHLRELRVRLRNSIIALMGGFGIAYMFKEEIALLMLEPYRRVWAAMKVTNPAFGEPAMYFTSMIEPFWAFFTMSLWAGLFISSPFVFYQLWKFIAPGLYQHERRYGVGFVAASVIFFSGGGVFCYLWVLEPMYQFLLGFATDNLESMAGVAIASGDANPLALKPLLTIQDYLSLARRMILAFGLVFELPLVIFFLSLVGAITHRGLLKFNRWWTVISFAVGAILTPSPDVFSQILMAGPMILLYNVSIIPAYMITKRREHAQAALEREEASASAAASPEEAKPDAEIVP
jgi:sec-independent protein translocase protein TatC